MTLLLVVAGCALASWALIAALSRSRWSRALADHPNERSLHEVPTARIGGLGLMAAALPVGFVLGPPELLPTLAAAAGLVLVSLADDVRSLPIQVRLPAHAAACALSYATLAAFPATLPQWLVAGVAVTAMVWMTNLYNFMDGADGLAGGMAVAGFGTLSLGAALAGEMPLALACAALASAAAGFLAHNFPPARVFLGDAGAIPLGFLAAALGLHGVLRGAWPAEFPLLCFSPFVVDASVTLLRRVARGEPFWKAHRSHYYQRLVLSGWSRRRLALVAYAVMIAACASALAGRTAGPAGRSAIISAWAVLYVLLLLLAARSLRRKSAASDPEPR